MYMYVVGQNETRVKLVSTRRLILNFFQENYRVFLQSNVISHSPGLTLVQGAPKQDFR